MNAMILKATGPLQASSLPLELVQWPVPEPGPEEVLIRVSACGVCHTELDEIEGRTPPAFFPIILGHQIVGRIEKLGAKVTTREVGERVGVGWIHGACGSCPSCQRKEENLCSHFRATGRDAHGGYAQLTVVNAAYACPLPPGFSDAAAAPLLCAGAIGLRSLRLSGIENGQSLGLMGFGASAHLVLQMTRWLYPDSPVYAFARSEQERTFALELGACWSSDPAEEPPQKLRAIIDTTPVWQPILHALQHLDSGGRLVINAIRKEETDKAVLQALDYPTHLWQEKEIKSVANVTRQDITETLELAARIPLAPEVQTFPLAEANQALLELRQRKIRGAKVLVLD